MTDLPKSLKPEVEELITADALSSRIAQNEGPTRRRVQGPTTRLTGLRTDGQEHQHRGPSTQ